MSAIQVVNNDRNSRFEVEQDGDVAYLRYELRPGKVALIHTEVPEELEGHGIGSALARAGLDYARANGLKALVLCPFIQSYLQRHPEYQDIVQA